MFILHDSGKGFGGKTEGNVSQLRLPQKVSLFVITILTDQIRRTTYNTIGLDFHFPCILTEATDP